MMPESKQLNIPVVSANQGQKLLALVRRLESEEDPNELAVIFDETKDALKCLIWTFSREGLLRRDVQRAEELLLSKGVDATGGSSNSKKSNQKNKRGRRKDNSKGSLSDEPSAASDERLLFMAINRILGLREDRFQPCLLLIMMSADLCSVILEYMRSGAGLSSSSVCRAEFELVASNWVALLNGLLKASKRLLEFLYGDSRSKPLEKFEILLDVKLHGFSNEISALESCLTALAAIISFYGGQLPRNASLAADLWALGFVTLTLPRHDVQRAAAEFLSSLSWTGVMRDTKNLTHVDGWSDFLMDVVEGFSTVLQKVLPLRQNLIPDETTQQSSKDTDIFFNDLVAYFQDGLEKDDEDAAFRFLLHGLSSLILAMLQRDALPGLDNASLLRKGRVSLDKICRLLETMLCFGARADSLESKQRACFVKTLGHKLARAFLSTLGIPPLMCRADRLLRMASSTLCAPSSITAPAFNGCVSRAALNQQWLSTSEPLKTEALRTFTAIVTLFGVPPTRASNNSHSFSVDDPYRSTGFGKSLASVGSTLLELLWSDGPSALETGSLLERVSQVNASAELLAAIIHSCGGFVPMPSRILVDSIVAGSLEALTSPAASRVALSPTAKAAILSLASVCANSPLPSGALSTVGKQLSVSARKCRVHDSDTTAAASLAARLYEARVSPRVPALFIDTRLHDFRLSGQPPSSHTKKHTFDQTVENELDTTSSTTDRKSTKKQPKSKRRKKASVGDVQDSVDMAQAATERPQEQQESNATTDLPAESASELHESTPASQTTAMKDIVVQDTQEEKEEEDDDDDDDALPAIFNDGPDDEDA